MKLAKIKPLPVVAKPGVYSIQNSYAQRGWNRQPGTAIGYPPLRGRSGKYLTGLDENCQEVQQLMLVDEQEGKRLQAEILERRLRLEAATGLDLTPNSDYYKNAYTTGSDSYNSGMVAEKVKLYDKENVFDLSDPLQEVKFWWAVQNREIIAPSLADYREGKCKHTVQFYVENEEAESDLVYKKNKSMVDAIKKLTELSLDVRKKVAKLCGLSITENDNEQIVYNKLYDFIMEGSIKNAKHYGGNSVDVFNTITSMSSAIMNTRYLVEQAIEQRIYNKRNGVVYEGDNMIAATEEQLIDQLAASNRSQEYLALEIKVADKQKLRGNIEGLSYLSLPKSDVTEKKVDGRKKKIEPDTELSE